jgi:hypothetical protein
VPGRLFQSLLVPCGADIYKSKHGGVCLCGQNWAVAGRFFQSLPVPCSDKQGRAARAAAAGRGLGAVPFLLKKSLGKTGGPASNQTKIQIFLKIIFIIEHILKTKIFLKKKIEKR